MPAQIMPDPVGEYFPPETYAITEETGAVDPLRSMVDAANEGMFAFIADVIRFRAQVSVQTASGPYLDYHGILYGVKRFPSELDDSYRARILATQDALTIPALTTLLVAYYAAFAVAGDPTTVTVFDLQRNPAAAAAAVVPDIVTGAPRTGLIPGEFMVDVGFTDPMMAGFVLGYAALGYSALLSTAPITYAAGAFPDQGAVAVVQPKKAACYRPVFRATVTLVG